MRVLVIVYFLVFNWVCASAQVLVGVTKETKIQSKTDTLLPQLSVPSAGQSLLTNWAIPIKNYGPSGLSTLAMRGTSASQTLITWDGIPLNSPLNGQVDLNTIDFRLFSKSTVGSSNQFGFSGGIGGTVDCKTQAINSMGLSIGSYGLRELFSSNIASNRILSWSQSTLIGSSTNNILYKILATSTEELSLSNASSQYFQHLETFSFKAKRLTFNISPWIGLKFRQIPASAIASPSNDWQNDSWFRIKLQMSDSVESKPTMNALVGIDNLNFFNSQSQTLSQYRVTYFRGAIQQLIHKNTWHNLAVKLSYRQEKIQSSSNSELQKNWQVIAPSFQEIIILGSTRVNLSGFQDVFQGKLPSPRFESSVNTQHKAWNLELSFSKNNRLPTINDLYWPNGGSAQLKPEQSYQQQLKIAYDKSQNFSAEIKAYNILISNYILWYPNANYWQVGNIGTVNSKGIETKIDGIFPLFGGQLRITQLNKYCNSTVLSAYEQAYIKAGGQMPFVPKLTSSLNVAYQKAGISLQTNTVYTSQRFIGNASENALISFFLFNSSLTKQIRLKSRGIYSISFRCENVFNTWYQWVPYYPQAGRTFTYSLSYQW